LLKVKVWVLRMVAIPLQEHLKKKNVLYIAMCITRSELNHDGPSSFDGMLITPQEPRLHTGIDAHEGYCGKSISLTDLPSSIRT